MMGISWQVGNLDNFMEMSHYPKTIWLYRLGFSFYLRQKDAEPIVPQDTNATDPGGSSILKSG
jgi:hypothetical protein